MLLHELLRNSSHKYPEKTAIVFQKERLSYRDLDRQSDALAEHLLESGLRKGDRVALFLENSTGYVISFFAILKAGGVVVPLNTQFVRRELETLLNNFTPKFVITDSTHQTSFKGLIDPKNILTHGASTHGDVPRQSEHNVASHRGMSPDMSPNDLAMIIYTSGTTGKPKGVMLSHANLNANASSIVEYLHLKHSDSIMVILPFYYSYGNSLLTTHIKVGATLVLDNRFVFPNVVLDLMEKEQVTGFAGVPSHFAILLRKSALRKYSLTSLRYVTQAGGGMAPSMIEEFTQAVPHVKFCVMYGQTEACARLTYLNPAFLKEKLGSIGKAIPGVQITVLNEQGEAVEEGQIGEIVAKGKNVMLGYWNSPEETKKILKKEGLWTGDLAKVDEEGFIYMVSRKKEMIKSGANRISPLEIEDVVCRMPGVIECAAVGMPDEILGEAIKLCVVKNGVPFTENDLLLFCKKNLAAFKMPKVVEFVESLPKTSTGKIKRS
ncbi:MAG: AMP-binding protein, partial [Candidatus Omnitrophota bacterium]